MLRLVLKFLDYLTLSNTVRLGESKNMHAIRAKTHKLTHTICTDRLHLRGKHYTLYRGYINEILCTINVIKHS